MASEKTGLHHKRSLLCGHSKVCRWLKIWLLILLFSMGTMRVHAEHPLNFDHLFEHHGSVMLIIDTDSGEIVHANSAAAEFYGYNIDQMQEMSIQEINQLDDHTIMAEMQAAAEEERNFFIFEHMLANGQTRTVEVYSYPYSYEGQNLLFSIIQDITPRLIAQQQAQQRTTMWMITLGAVAVLLLLMIFILLKRREERKKHLATLFQQNSRYQALISASNTGAWEYNKITGTMKCSPEYYAIRGIYKDDNAFSSSDDLMKVVFNHVHPSDRGKAMKRFYQYLDDPQGMYENLFRIKHDNGSWRWVLSRGKTLLNESGQPTAVTVGTHIDITDSVIQQEKLRVSNERLHQLAEQSRSIAWEVDETGLYTFVSEVAESVIGYRPEELIGEKHFYDLHPAQGREAFKTEILAGFGGVKSFRGVINPVETKDGQVIWVSSNGLPLYHEDGSLKGYRGSDIDVTELKRLSDDLYQRERYLSKILETSLDGFWIIGEGGQFTEVNQAYCHMSGYTREELLSLKISDIEAAETPEETAHRIEKIMRQGYDQFETKHRKRDGSLFDVEVSVTAMESEKSVLICFCRDITQRKEAEGLMLEAKEKAEEANQAKNTFLANMTHELKTPLHGIMGVNQLLETTTLSEEQREYVKLSQKSSENLLRIIQDILDFTKLQADYLVLEEHVVSLPELTNELEQLFSMTASKKGIEYRYTMDESVPNHIMADGFRLKQILTNLLSNALKFTQKGFVELSVHTMGDPDNQVRLQFRVKDTGRGIPPEHQERIFERFHQVEEKDSKVFHGTGLGLPIAKNLAELMQGSLKVESTVGEGSEFTFDGSFDLVQ